MAWEPWSSCWSHQWHRLSQWYSFLHRGDCSRGDAKWYSLPGGIDGTWEVEEVHGNLAPEIWGMIFLGGEARDSRDSLFLNHFETWNPWSILRSHLWILWTLIKFKEESTLRALGSCWELRMHQRKNWMRCMEWCPTSLESAPCLWTNVTNRWQWEVFPLFFGGGFWGGEKWLECSTLTLSCGRTNRENLYDFPQSLRYGVWCQSALWLHLSSWATSPGGLLKGLGFHWTLKTAEV